MDDLLACIFLATASPMPRVLLELRRPGRAPAGGKAARLATCPALPPLSWSLVTPATAQMCTNYNPPRHLMKHMSPVPVMGQSSVGSSAASPVLHVPPRVLTQMGKTVDHLAQLCSIRTSMSLHSQRTRRFIAQHHQLLPFG